MGYSQSSVAVKGKVPAIVRKSLGLELTGKCEELAESSINGVELPGNWYVIISDHDELGLMEEQTLRRLSTDCELVACFIEEHCVASAAVAWQNGQPTWSVYHDAQMSRPYFESKGNLPAMFNEICDRWQTRQKAEDAAIKRVDYIIEIPVEVAHSVTGYRHDRDLPGLKERPYEILIESRSKDVNSSGRPIEKSWLRRLFGRVKRR